MTYISPTPEDAFGELEILAKAFEIEGSSSKQICTRFRADYVMAVFLDDLRRNDYSQDVLDRRGAARVQVHVENCYHCQEHLRDYQAFLTELHSLRTPCRRSELDDASANACERLFGKRQV